MAGSIATLKIFSGVLWATSSISMPPSVEAMMVTREVARSSSKPEIQLALDVAAFLDIQPLHFLARRPGLLGHQHLTQHLAGIGYNVLNRLDDAHAALPLGVILETARASAARMDLGLHHPDRAAQLICDLLGFGSG